ncbi:aryl hydrocarbon receptor nuclear translocator like protein [Ditylenchus destructor]|nr:aryl hydrocarbon receptor nuclear translocator like protein [Ditylenchus destructor]
MNNIYENDFDQPSSSAGNAQPMNQIGASNNGFHDMDASMPMAPGNSNANMTPGQQNGENKDRFARENHSEIERRRRNKMTFYINVSARNLM